MAVVCTVNLNVTVVMSGAVTDGSTSKRKDFKDVFVLSLTSHDCRRNIDTSTHNEMIKIPCISV